MTLDSSLGSVLIGCVAGLCSAGIAIATFWFTFGRTIGTSEAEARSETQSALQIAAEALEEVKKIGEKIERADKERAEREGDLEKALFDMADTIRREFGGTVEAIRQKIHDVELWVRDEFKKYALRDSLKEALTRLEAGQTERDNRLYKRIEDIDRKLESRSARRDARQ